jgi:hypothetical protein
MAQQAHQLDHEADLPPELLRLIAALARAHVEEDYAALQAESAEAA